MLFGKSNFLSSVFSIVCIYICFLRLTSFCIFQVAGVEFPPREENSVPLFTQPQTHPVTHHPASAYEDAAIEASLQSDASGLRY